MCFGTTLSEEGLGCLGGLVAVHALCVTTTGMDGIHDPKRGKKQVESGALLLRASAVWGRRDPCKQKDREIFV